MQCVVFLLQHRRQEGRRAGAGAAGSCSGKYRIDEQELAWQQSGGRAFSLTL